MCVFVYAYPHTYVYMYMCVYIHTYIYIHLCNIYICQSEIVTCISHGPHDVPIIFSSAIPTELQHGA